MVFETLALIGFLGFLALVLMGSVHGHGSGHGHAAAHGHDAHALPGHHAHHGDMGHHTHAHDHATAKGHHHGEGQGGPIRFLLWLSPMNLFSLCLGMGATGMLLQKSLAGVLLWLAAIAGGLFFLFVIVKPWMSVLLKFAAEPSKGLEGTVAQEAEALSAFDQQGRGVVTVTLDGQLVQMLARLDQAELGAGLHIRKGDKLFITSVDAKKGTCVVSGELLTPYSQPTDTDTSTH